MLRTFSLGFVVALAACGTAQVVWRTPAGGVIELRGDRNTAMDRANNEMGGHCGAYNYTVVAEGYEPVGTDRTYGQTTNTSASGGTSTSGYDSERTAMVWRVHYQCTSAMGQGPQPMPAAAPPLPEPMPQEPVPQEPPPPPPPSDY
jgi:hypothetical protein